MVGNVAPRLLPRANLLLFSAGLPIRVPPSSEADFAGAAGDRRPHEAGRPSPDFAALHPGYVPSTGG
jgi:hypothetical protein